VLLAAINLPGSGMDLHFFKGRPFPDAGKSFHPRGRKSEILLAWMARDLYDALKQFTSTPGSI
jgi:hypothetical protein